MEQPKIRIGISSCLLGMKVRFDGGHKHDGYLTQTLGHYFEWIPVCPEVSIGMGVPRENVRLTGTAEDPLMIAPKSGNDYTDKMKRYSDKKVHELGSSDIHGYILKKDSPTCGMERVRVYDKNTVPAKTGTGIFARYLLDGLPLLPVEEEGRLKDHRLRENFIERIFAHYRLQKLMASQPTAGKLVRFHTQHKLSLMSHSIKHYQELGRLVARAGAEKEKFPELLNAYAALFMTALKMKATTRRHTNVLHHIIGFFKKVLDPEDKTELVEVIDQYREGYVPLIVPLTLIKHHLRRHPVQWMTEQIYLNPYPNELMLRNFV